MRLCKSIGIPALLATSSLFLSNALAQTIQAPGAVEGPGDTKRAAIEVCMPPGERAYLSRLVCPDGMPPTFSRIGSYGNRNEVPNP